MIAWFKRLLHRRSVEAEMRAEMDFHVQARAADLARQQGLSKEEALRQARIDFGSTHTYHEEARAALGFRLLDELRADIVYAIRTLRRSAGFAFATVSILALAIGVNAAFFTLYNNHAVRSLPIRAVERHYGISGLDRYASSTGGWTREEVHRLEQASSGEIEGIYTASGLLQVLLISPVQRQIMAVAVTANYFPLLGANMAMGRAFTIDEEAQPVAVLSYNGWQRLFPDQSSPLGKAIRIRSTWFTVAGVSAPSFTGSYVAVPDLWVGEGMRQALTTEGENGQPASAMLRPGIAPERAEAVLSATATRFERPKERAIARIECYPRRTFINAERVEAQLLIALLFSSVFLILLIACANLVNLFLSRMAARDQEIATRFALGAGRGRIVRQLLTESTLLAMGGALVGCGIALAGVSRFHEWSFSLVTTQGMTVLPLTFDWTVFAYSAALGLFAGAAFGLFPAIKATTIVRRRPGRLRGLLLTGQVAASFVLLMVAGVLVRNVQHFDSIRAGYDLQRNFDLQLEPATAPVLDRLKLHPGVASSTVVQRVPLYFRMFRQPAKIAGKSVTLPFNYVDDRYFETIGLSLVSGRGFQPDEARTNAKVAIISQATARQFWPEDTGLGQVFTLAESAGEGESIPGAYQVIGIAPDVVNGWLFEGVDSAMVYLPAGVGDSKVRSAIVRLKDSSPAAIAQIREVCASVPSSSGCDPRSLESIAGMMRFAFQAPAAVAGALGLAALLLTTIGLYSVISYSVEQRRREIGVLVAIGARPADVTRRIVGEAAGYFVIGMAVALPLCLALSQLASSSELRIRTFDAGAYLGVPAVLVLVAALACLVPIRRALTVEPMTALRQE